MTEVVVGQTSVTKHVSRDMAFLSGFELEKTVIRNVALLFVGRYHDVSKFCIGVGTSVTLIILLNVLVKYNDCLVPLI